MLEFKEFELSDYRLINEFRQRSWLKTCELAAGTVFMWRDFYKPSFCVHGDALIIKRETDDGEGLFFFPLGSEVDSALDAIEEYCLQNGKNLTFYGVEDGELEYLKKRYNGKVSYRTARAWCDYLYDAEEFAAFKGRKYNGQRNHINKFKRLYPGHTVTPFTKSDVPEALALIDLYAEQKGIDTKMGLREVVKAKECVENFESLCISGICVRVGGMLASFSLGEKCGKTQVIHIEKASREYEGIYPFTANAYACAVAGSVEILNREDDAGDPGLRKSKLQYQPVELMNKYYVSLIRPEMRLSGPPTLLVKDLVLNGIEDGDAEDYLALNTDDDNNRYWGYDYRADLPVPTADGFMNMVKADFKNKTSVSLAVRQGGKLMGEAVFYNFRFGGVCEVGLRLKEELQGKGYATEIFKRVSDFLQNELHFYKLVARCYKQNTPSFKMITGAGYKAVREDDAMLYFER